MSRVGKQPVTIPSGVKVALAGRVITVEGKLGKLHWEHRPEVSLQVDDAGRTLTVQRRDDQRFSRALHGLTRAMVQNMVVGVTEGYQRRLEVVGVGYLAAVLGKVLQLRVGLANELQVPVPPELNVTCPDQQHVLIQGIDKQKVTHFAAAVRSLRKPEPYKGKGIRYEGEQVRRKQGKATVK
jgi:large subunit ribosomal protein L6